MFTVRPYKEEDAAACGDCFYEGFFSCSVDQNDKILLFTARFPTCSADPKNPLQAVRLAVEIIIGQGQRIWS